MFIFKSLLKLASFFEAPGAVAKIGSSLYQTTITKLSLSKSLKKSVVAAFRESCLKIVRLSWTGQDCKQQLENTAISESIWSLPQEPINRHSFFFQNQLEAIQIIRDTFLTPSPCDISLSKITSFYTLSLWTLKWNKKKASLKPLLLTMTFYFLQH